MYTCTCGWIFISWRDERLIVNDDCPYMQPVWYSHWELWCHKTFYDWVNDIKTLTFQLYLSVSSVNQNIRNITAYLWGAFRSNDLYNLQVKLCKTHRYHLFCRTDTSKKNCSISVAKYCIEFLCRDDPRVNTSFTEINTVNN